MRQIVFDTNIVSEMMRNNPNVITRMRLEAQTGYLLLGCPTVWYEVRRGLVAKGASIQMKVLETIFVDFIWQDYTRDDWTLASDLWAKRTTRGLPISDADLLIAVFALNRSAILVTNNEKDFAELGVTVENWTKA